MVLFFKITHGLLRLKSSALPLVIYPTTYSQDQLDNLITLILNLSFLNVKQRRTKNPSSYNQLGHRIH